jgi:hypothetical protein
LFDGRVEVALLFAARREEERCVQERPHQMLVHDPRV